LVQALVGLLIGYLAGAIPTGAVVGRLGGVDLTQVGSRRTGATNVLRTLGPGAAAVVFLGDMLKGALAMLLIGALFDRDPWPEALAGIAAVVGHAYSPFIGFKGGRGVTTGLGGLAILSPPAAGLALLVGAAAIAATRYVSLGSILGTTVGCLALLVAVFVHGQPIAQAAFATAVGAFIVAAHHDNIQRLLHGTERKLGQRVERT
jgi:glycerol-3-phosphate acyltransferase PlsY